MSRKVIKADSSKMPNSGGFFVRNALIILVYRHIFEPIANEGSRTFYDCNTTNFGASDVPLRIGCMRFRTGQ